jgi:release factor glutamine methyltransferase
MKKISVTYAQALTDSKHRFTKFFRNKQTAVREAEAILLFASGITREKLYVSFNDKVPVKVLKKFINLTALRLSHIPLQYITGSECFYGREFKIKTGVFIPRPDTETLIEAVKSVVKTLPPGAVAADCGSGSGILSITILKESDKIKTFNCFDTNQKALDLTLTNAMTHGVSRAIKLHHGDFFAICKRGHMRFDLIVSNPPYIRLNDLKTLQKEVLKEPRAALTDGSHGYTFYEKFAMSGGSIINPGGFLALEIGDNMGGKTRKIFDMPCWEFINAFKDFRNKERVLVFRYKFL